MQRVSCEGAPRDLGLDQGRACRDAVRADARALGWEGDGSWLGALCARAGARSARALSRDLARHFPHLDERISGLAAGAGLPREALLVLLEEELGDPLLLGAGITRGNAGTQLVVALRAPLPLTGLVARNTRPDGGYRHLALTRPGLVAALAGVNEGGLAGAVELLDPPAPHAPGCGVPSALLLDQCLERLDTVEKALEWCERRPGGGRARIVCADSSGAVGALDLDGDTRTRREPQALELATDETRARALLDPIARAIELRLPGVPADRLALGSWLPPRGGR